MSAPVGRSMPTGIVLGAQSNAANVVDDVVSQARRAYQLGVRQIWLAQQFDHDAIARNLYVFQSLTGNDFRAAVRIDVGRVDEVDAGVDGAGDEPVLAQQVIARDHR